MNPKLQLLILIIAGLIVWGAIYVADELTHLP